jgi:hypothetical protein
LSAHVDKFLLGQHAIFVGVERREAAPALGLIGEVLEKLREG